MLTLRARVLTFRARFVVPRAPARRCCARALLLCARVVVVRARVVVAMMLMNAISLCHVTAFEFFLDNQIFGHGFQSEIDRLKITITVQMKRVIPFPLELELASLAQGQNF